jgi:hypothetical protein
MVLIIKSRKPLTDVPLHIPTSYKCKDVICTFSKKRPRVVGVTDTDVVEAHNLTSGIRVHKHYALLP